MEGSVERSVLREDGFLIEYLILMKRPLDFIAQEKDSCFQRSLVASLNIEKVMWENITHQFILTARCLKGHKNPLSVSLELLVSSTNEEKEAFYDQIYQILLKVTGWDNDLRIQVNRDAIFVESDTISVSFKYGY